MAHNIDFSWLGETQTGNNTTPLMDPFPLSNIPPGPAVGISESLSDALVSILLRLDKVKIDALTLALSRVTAHLSRIDASTFAPASTTVQLDRIEAALSSLGQDRTEDLSRLGRIEADVQQITYSVHQLVKTQSRIESLVLAVSEAVDVLREKLAEFSKSVYQLVQGSPNEAVP